MKRRIMPAVAVLMTAVLNAGAYFNGGLGQTFGRHNYRGTSGYLIIGSENGLWLRPSLSFYKSDIVKGKYKTYAVRGGYDAAAYGISAEAGATPKEDGYGNRFAAADITFSLSSSGGKKSRIAGPQSGGGAARGKGLAGVDVGAGIRHTAHTDELNALRAIRPSEAAIGQTDLLVFAGAKFLSTNVSGQYTKSGYDKTLSGGYRVSQRTALAGMTAIIQGFPSQSWNFRAEWASMPVVRPFFSYTHTQFKLSQPNSDSYAAGASVGLDMLQLNGTAEVYDPGGGAEKENFFSLGAALRF
ncbi:MAG: hypothetical protein ABIG11_04390 [bacterium]